MKKKHAFTRKLNMGRSMTEMLAVLAVIGVLSIGGLSAYKMAMNSHKANEILDYVNLVLVEKQAQLLTSSLPDTEEEIDACSDLLDGRVNEHFDVCLASKSDNAVVVNFVLLPAYQNVAESLVNKLGIERLGDNGSWATLSFCLTSGQNIDGARNGYINRACAGFEDI